VKANKIMNGQLIPNYRRRKGKKVESNIDSGAHNQTLKQQKQLSWYQFSIFSSESCVKVLFWGEWFLSLFLFPSFSWYCATMFLIG
jgi:hypothetical protein